jgi:hypothetical protein
LGIEDGEITRETEICFLPVDFHLLSGKRSFEAVSNSLVVRPKHHGISAFHVQAEFIVVVSNLREFLAHHRLKHLVVVPFLRPGNLHLAP